MLELKYLLHPPTVSSKCGCDRKLSIRWTSWHLCSLAANSFLPLCADTALTGKNLGGGAWTFSSTWDYILAASWDHLHTILEHHLCFFLKWSSAFLSLQAARKNEEMLSRGHQGRLLWHPKLFTSRLEWDLHRGPVTQTMTGHALAAEGCVAGRRTWAPRGLWIHSKPSGVRDAERVSGTAP